MRRVRENAAGFQRYEKICHMGGQRLPSCGGFCLWCAGGGLLVCALHGSRGAVKSKHQIERSGGSNATGRGARSVFTSSTLKK